MPRRTNATHKRNPQRLLTVDFATTGKKPYLGLRKPAKRICILLSVQSQLRLFSHLHHLIFSLLHPLFNYFVAMKKTLLFLGLLGFAGSAQAQAPWVEVNLINSAAFAPGYIIRDIKTVSPTVSWMVTEENSAAGNPTAFFVTNNAAGTQFDFGAISAAGGAANYQTGNISAVNATTAVAATYPVSGAGGEILRTTNGGISWTKVTTASQFVGTQQGFCNFVHMFDANVGVSLGDPTNSYYEILRTTDGGLTWTRVPSASIPAPLADEYGLARSYFTRGNTIWCGLGSSVESNPVRVLKSIDRGVTWTVSGTTALLGSISRLAFKDDLNGIAYNRKVNAAGTGYSEVNVIRTSDGGATWTPAYTPANTPTGSFFINDVDAVDGKYFSCGSRFGSASPFASADLGTSYSTDGITWTQLSSGKGFTTLDVVSGATTGTISGYAGFVTDASGVGGIFKITDVTPSPLPLATHDAVLQSALSVYPNPSTSGVFKVDLGSTLKAGAQLTVVDAMGRQVQSQTLTATAIGSRVINLDLSREKTGIYTLQIRTEAGIATQKLVID